jgi:hypothetical protein
MSTTSGTNRLNAALHQVEDGLGRRTDKHYERGTTASCKKTDETSQSSTTSVAAPPPPADERFSAVMDGLSERPTTLNTGATGSADFTITAGGSVNYTITVNGLSSSATGAHIHGPADANAVAGPIVAFDSLPQATTGTLASGTISAAQMQGNGISIDSLKSLMRNGMAYVNIHTANHKDGEIRGQIVKR